MVLGPRRPTLARARSTGRRPVTTVHTVGHGTKTTEELLGVLRSTDIETLIDVRRFPGSRRHPHLGREGLERALPAAGLAYEWWGEELGGRRSGRRDAPSRHPAWRNASFRAYADHMDTPEFRTALERLVLAAGERRIAIMCAETVWWRCHRRLIADALVVRGVEVVHLLSERRSEPHKLHEAARADEEGRVVYDVGFGPVLFDG